MSKPSPYSKVIIPLELAKWAVKGFELKNVNKTNRCIKYVNAFCHLKAYSNGSSTLINYRDHLVAIADFIGISVRTLEEQLSWLIKEGWCTKDGRHIMLDGWKRLHQKLEIPYQHEFFQKPNNCLDEVLHYWIYLVDIKDNQRRQAYKVRQKLMEDNSIRMIVYNELEKMGVDSDRLMKDDFYLCDRLMALYKTGFRLGFDIQELLIQIRPDVNRGCRGMAKSWEAGSAMTATRIKKKLAKAKAAIIEKVATIESSSRQRNPYCAVNYNHQRKTTFHPFCDQISICKYPFKIEKMLAA